MISVTFTESGDKLSLRVEGHAGYAEAGKDIVCAAASILAYTLASIVDSLEAESMIDLTSGDTVISCEATSKSDLMIAKAAFMFAVRGYALLEHNYPQYVRLNKS